MNLKRHFARLLFFILLAPLFASAQDLTSDSIDVFIKTKMLQKHIPALQLSVIRNNKVVKLSTYGTANLENNIPATDQSIFSINSITKAFTGVAIMQLAEEGKLKTTDRLSVYLDSLPDAWQKITLQQVLTHTSGLPDILDEDEQILGNGVEKAALQKAKALPMEFSIGDKFSYNQTGYVLLGQIINKLSGMHFTKFIEERQFKIAGMPLTRFGDSYDVVPNSAGAYTMTKLVNGQFVRNQTPGVGYIQFPLFFRTAAGIQSTAADMANWIIALKEGKLLKQKSSIETMWTPAILNNGKVGGFNRLTNGYALGWPTLTRNDHPAVGPVGGGRSALFIYLKDDLSIVVLTNLMGGNPDQFIDEIAGYYVPELHEANGFGLSPDIKKLRAGLLKQGFNHAASVAADLQKGNAGFNLEEKALNEWGYQLLSQKKPAEALTIFKLNTTLYPTSANTYDSYAEVLELTDNKKDALVNYKMALKLDPKNKNAEDRIKKLSDNN
ncbi:serine hydrolase [Mucilaginibacter gilvus]|uniref:Class A beta-lactamase-related serine hydrolase n=1 Tax=Mucilaginibacter gilvus TaxID=2305909 RepID=A0A444MQC2_9SPHI|nr:serine hydrolase [Mucilaginibacter gilvus]RWY53848.1 class A beta-lactamase-related serine hydrolase [Mucilaginibacter gilvus]